MKKVLLALLLIVLSLTLVAATIVYVNSSGASLYVDGKLLQNGETISYDEFVYVDGLTVSTVTTYPNIVLASTDVTVATDTTILVSFTELTDVEIIAKPASVTWYMYFNHTGTNPIKLPADVSYSETFNTSMFDKVYFKVTGTSTSNLVLTILKK